MHGEKCPHVVIQFIHKAQNRQRQRDRKPVHGCQARGVGEQGVTDMCWDSTAVTAAQHLNVLSATELCTLRWLK